MSLLAANASAGDWQTGVVDGAIGGKYSSLKIDKFGNAHVAYEDPSNGYINYSFWDHGLKKWFSTNIDRGSGFCTLVLDSKQHPHISYPEDSNRIKSAYWDGTSWKRQVANIQATIINWFTSIAVDSNDNPSMTFYEEIGVGGKRGRLRMVTWNGKFWELRTVDSDLGAGKFNSVTIDSKGNPHIAYADVEYANASLRYASWNGQTWDVEILEGAGQPGTNMWSVSMLLDKNDVPHIAYTDVRKLKIKYATKVNGKWQLSDVDTISDVAFPDRNGIALDETGTPYISYFDSGAGVLKVAHRDKNGWVSETVDQGYVGLTSSIQIFDDWIWVTYSDLNGVQLRVARRKIERAVKETNSASK